MIPLYNALLNLYFILYLLRILLSESNLSYSSLNLHKFASKYHALFARSKISTLELCLHILSLFSRLFSSSLRSLILLLQSFNLKRKLSHLWYYKSNQYLLNIFFRSSATLSLSWDWFVLTFWRLHFWFICCFCDIQDWSRTPSKFRLPLLQKYFWFLKIWCDFYQMDPFPCVLSDRQSQVHLL